MISNELGKMSFNFELDVFRSYELRIHTIPISARLVVAK